MARINLLILIIKSLQQDAYLPSDSDSLRFCWGRVRLFVTYPDHLPIKQTWPHGMESVADQRTICELHTLG
ncbi:hypothetical protein BTW15_25415 [Pseudomonas syringae pv. tomato]|uniref:Uncharacterized protein n=11 Tax=Pseudomonas syringae group TaxID=136849 RepID=A0A2G7PBG6_PSESF|nr:hypothetical protein JN853_28685 [Pseudomonas syringae pv. actinidiae ICMP 9853]AQX57051.1 hypothetical protein B1R35_01810 [Pseudomonas syringae pv. actinidiae]AVB22650.1 hypothetical protein BKM03_28075 [Pseudomonas avellanae]AVI87250.1 hypothetical protein XJ28_27830 [Pseudomonas syringae pv. tomato]AYL78820.1 hypothetical protein CN228_01640 [Pseudomonas syringae pv. actinidiae str. Shaanxi_M228]KPX14652.1 hypothetical protein ALO72_101692 [Pseudomonas syringae pv. delphinii]KPZ09581.1